MKPTQTGPHQMLLGETLAPCLKSERGSFITIADSIEALVCSQPGLTELEIAKTLFDGEGDLQRVHMMCRRLIAEGRLTRNGVGTTANPFTYSPKAVALPLISDVLCDPTILE